MKRLMLIMLFACAGAQAGTYVWTGAAKYDILRFAGEVPETLPTFTLVGVDDENWCVRLVGRKFRAAYRCGALIMVK